MSYLSISIKDAVNNINDSLNGWFLPSVQRPYVWGSRYESELYICKLFDSLLRGYPIGGLILWNTSEEIPYREFMNDYVFGKTSTIVDKGLWGRQDKWLIYDGQQRLQTLYSCLKYTFNNKILVFDLLYNMDKEEPEADETGFIFVERDTNILPHQIRMNKLFCKTANTKEKIELRNSIKKECSCSEKDGALIEENFERLWDIFVENETKSLAYFPISNVDESKVNDIFQRLNTGGIPLSQADLLLSRIKEDKDSYDFEEQLQEVSKLIYNVTGKGYLFDPYSILQTLYLLVKETTRVDSRMIKSERELRKFKTIWEDLRKPLISFFADFMWGQFKINNTSIVPKKLAILPMIMYFFEIYNKNFSFKQMSKAHILALKKYFILSQINDWNLQTMVSHFSRIIKEKSTSNAEMFIFPLEDIKDFIRQKDQRQTDLLEVNFIDYKWFSLKIMTPQRTYQFEPDFQGRFNPEIDHIFPKKLKDQEAEYYSCVDIVWNMQPVKGEINNFKRRRHPKEFFSNEGGSYISNDYDLLPTYDLNDKIWSDPIGFINSRKTKMKEFLKNEYELSIITKTSELV